MTNNNNATVATSLGNTKTNDAIKDKQARGWTFTLNNYDATELHLLQEFCKKKKYIIGKEVGEQGTPHLQGYLYSKSPIRWSTMKKLNNRMHFEAAKGSMDDNRKYCSKEGDFETNIPPPKLKKKERDAIKKERILKNQYKDIVWRDWQQDVINICNEEQETRKIYWFWEKTGNVGKSFITRYLFLQYGGILCSGKTSDVFNQCVKYDEENEGEDPKFVLCDIPRTSIDYVNYGALEKIKDRLLFSGKYEGAVVYYENSPHIVCFANEPPDTSKMSADRWIVKEIGGDSTELDEEIIINI